MLISSGTAATTKAFLAALAISGPATVSTLPDSGRYPQYTVAGTTTSSLSPLLRTISFENLSTTATHWDNALSEQVEFGDIDRRTTAKEQLAGEIRSWALRTFDWDGENAETPIISSLYESVDFIALLNETDELPEPMLFSTGHAGLFWNTDTLYADLKFLGNRKIAYFIESSNEGKHKGIAHFESQKMPAVFSALLKV